MRSTISLALLASLASFDCVSAATAAQWHGKSIYQIITDRFAPPSADAPARTAGLPTTCDPHDQTWCGGTWLSIIDKLDYIQGMGMDAIWISPTQKNIDVHTPYNYAYHGYWVQDPTQVNPRFGSEADLHALVSAVHARGMYIMADIVVNSVPALNVSEALDSNALSAGGSFWTDPSQFHPQCWIDYTNGTSIEQCWMGDANLPLMDVNTEDKGVQDTLQKWIASYVSTYNIDGLRIDAAKHIQPEFWPGFCGAAGVFCIGEVYGDDIPYASTYQTQNVMDSILGYPLYGGIAGGFGAPMGNMSHFVSMANGTLSAFPHPELLANFIENHDLPRWRNATVDPQLGYNAMVAQFFFEGLPLVYYGQEQDFGDGAGDPYNRQALWPSNYANTTTYNRIAMYNEIRHALISNGTTFQGKNFLDSQATIVASTPYDVAIRKGPILAMLTNRGSPSQAASFGVSQSGWATRTTLVDLLSCQQFIVMADDSVTVSYAGAGQGGQPYLFMSTSDATSLGFCGLGGGVAAVTSGTGTGSDSSANSGGGSSSNSSSSAAMSMIAPHPAVLGAGVLVLVAAGAFGRFFA